jgi:YgiT-type zinc finger domain-containing protein
MKCHVCGGKMNNTSTDLPFKINAKAIVILKGLPVYQCENCIEYLLPDEGMEKMDRIFENLGESVELEIIQYAV